MAFSVNEGSCKDRHEAHKEPDERSPPCSSVAGLPTKIIPPAPEQVAVLLGLAKIGDITVIRQQSQVYVHDQVHAR